MSSNESQHKSLSSIYYLDPTFTEGNSILDSLNGFILIANTNSEVFYSSRTVEQYLGFHQSDIIHQSIYELIHSEDRDEFKRQLQWNSRLPPEKSDLTLQDLLTKPEYKKYLDRNFTVRFRCLLDNTSGFVTLDIIGRLSVLYGQHGITQYAPSIDNQSLQTSKNQHLNTTHKAKNIKLMNQGCINGSKDDEPLLALFAIACPFGPSSLFELSQRDNLFKTKHKVNLTVTSIDQRGKLILGYNEQDLVSIGAYDLIHSNDLNYYLNAHKELLKTGSCGLVCYRVLTKDQHWQWIQTSMRIIYKSNKPECIIANHRPLSNDEGEELYYKRGFEYKLPYPCLNDFDGSFNGIINSLTNPDTNRLSSNSSSLLKTKATSSSSNNTNKTDKQQQRPSKQPRLTVSNSNAIDAYYKMGSFFEPSSSINCEYTLPTSTSNTINDAYSSYCTQSNYYYPYQNTYNFYPSQNDIYSSNVNTNTNIQWLDSTSTSTTPTTSTTTTTTPSSYSNYYNDFLTNDYGYSTNLLTTNTTMMNNNNNYPKNYNTNTTDVNKYLLTSTNTSNNSYNKNTKLTTTSSIGLSSSPSSLSSSSSSSSSSSTPQQLLNTTNTNVLGITQDYSNDLLQQYSSSIASTSSSFSSASSTSSIFSKYIFIPFFSLPLIFTLN